MRYSIYLPHSFSWNIVENLSTKAEEYEYDIYRQLIELEHSNDPTKHTEFFTETGRFRARIGKDRNWKQDLVSMLKDSSLYISKTSTWSDQDMIYFLDNILVPYVDFWLNNTNQGTKFIASQGIEALVKELQTGKWYNKNNSGVLVEGKNIKNKQGIRRETDILSGLSLWLNKQDNDSVIIDTIDFDDSRHQEGRFDILVKLSKEKTHNDRRPMRFESKSSVNDFVIGTLDKDLYNCSRITTVPTGKYTQDGAPIYKIFLVFSKEKVQSYVDNYLTIKYSKGGEFGKANILPIFTNGHDYLLFSDFLVGAQNNLNISIPEEIRDPSIWRNDDPNNGYNALLEPGVKLAVDQITNKVFRHKLATLSPKLTYGKPKI